MRGQVRLRKDRKIGIGGGGVRAVFIGFHKQKSGPPPLPQQVPNFSCLALLGNPQSRLSEGSGQVAERQKNRYWRGGGVRAVFIGFHKQKSGPPATPPAGT